TAARAERSSGPVRRTAAGTLYAGLPGSSWSRNQSRRCAKESGRVEPAARREGHRELRGGRRLENTPQRQLRTQLLVQARRQMGGEERVAPEIEEAVV